jgi:hypothetical protein
VAILHCICTPHLLYSLPPCRTLQNICIKISVNISALLYVKLNVLEDGGSSIKTCKTRRFAPNISVHLRPDKDNSAITVQLPSNTEHLSCQISLCTKPTLGECTGTPIGAYLMEPITMKTVIGPHLSRYNPFSVIRTVISCVRVFFLRLQKDLLIPVFLEKPRLLILSYE